MSENCPFPAPGPRSSACPTHCPPTVLPLGLPFVAISQGPKPNEMLLSPADPRAHTLGGFSPSGLFAQTGLTRAACLCVASWKPPFSVSRDRKQAVPGSRPSSMDFSRSRNLELAHRIPARYLAVSVAERRVGRDKGGPLCLGVWCQDRVLVPELLLHPCGAVQGARRGPRVCPDGPARDCPAQQRRGGGRGQ